MTEPEKKPAAKVMRMEEAFWELPPAHFQASSYQPRGYAEVHVREVAENLYYILSGKGVVELDGVKHLVEPHMVIHIPPGVRHGIFNTGLEDLVFLVVASPPYDMPAVKQTGGRDPA